VQNIPYREQSSLSAYYVNKLMFYVVNLLM